ncbi:MAG TPA: Maf family protein [Chloroflexia bacterium]|nr:Maf family protein [Chloroflexia bacterium]
MPQIPVVLASRSPRRLELLARIVPAFLEASSDVEDTGSDLMPEVPLDQLNLNPGFYVPPASDPRLWAWRKAADVASSRVGSHPGNALFLGADTVVLRREGPLGKPKSPADATDMLRSLRGTDHYVLTGVAILSLAEHGFHTRALEVCASSVTMRDFSDMELEGYVETGEPMDKAGAYALQGLGGALVETVQGCHTNVVGLPLCLVRTLLLKEGVEVLEAPPGRYCENCMDNSRLLHGPGSK